MTEPRVISDQGLNAKIADIASPVLEGLGYQVVRVRVTGTNGCTLQIMAERPDGTITVEDCEKISRELSPVLDADDPIDRAYYLEISSPGMDRPLVRKADFLRWKGYIAKIEMAVLIEGQKRFKGTIDDIRDDGIELGFLDPGPDDPDAAILRFDGMSDARLVVTDAVIEESLRQQKAAAKQPKPEEITDQ